VVFEIPKVSCSGKILEVLIGHGDKAIMVGGETCYPFYTFEGQMPRRPVLAMEVWDMIPEDWPNACLKPVADVINDSGAWAKKCVEQFGAEAIAIQLKSTDPNGLDALPKEASNMVGKVIAAVDVPVIIWGSGNANKDAETLKCIAEDFQGKNLLLGPVDESNYKAVGAAALAYKHSVISSSPIDVNLAKQINILLSNLGMPMDRIIIDPTTGGLGYGMEYCYSVMERIRMAALVQEDDKLMLPMINNIGNEVWKSKEAKLSDEMAPDLGDSSMRGVLMETTAAVSFLLAGSDILILRHPKTLTLIRNFIDKLTTSRVTVVKSKKVDRPKVVPISASTKKFIKSVATSESIVAPSVMSITKPATKVAFLADKRVRSEVVEEAKVEVVEKVHGKDTEEAAKTKAAEEVKVKAAEKEAAKAKTAEEVKVKAVEEAAAKIKAAKEAIIKAAVVHDNKKAAEMVEITALRLQRAKEHSVRIETVVCSTTRKENMEYISDRKQGTAGPDALYICRILERWSLRGPGFLR